MYILTTNTFVKRSVIIVSQLANEASLCRAWLYSHISDHSASNHGVQILLSSLSSSDIVSVDSEHINTQHVVEIINSLNSNQELIQLRPGSEALWCQRRSLFRVLLSDKGLMLSSYSNLTIDIEDSVVSLSWIDIDTDGENADPIDTSISCNSKDESISVLQKILLHENQLYIACCGKKDAWSWEAQKKFARRYILFILYTVRFILYAVGIILFCLLYSYMSFLLLDLAKYWVQWRYPPGKFTSDDIQWDRGHRPSHS